MWQQFIHLANIASANNIKCVMCAICTLILRDDPTGNYASMAPPLVMTPASAWMGGPYVAGPGGEP
jgi:hypothetical protein